MLCVGAPYDPTAFAVDERAVRSARNGGDRGNDAGACRSAFGTLTFARHVGFENVRRRPHNPAHPG